MISSSTDSTKIVSIRPASLSPDLLSKLPKDKSGRFSGAHFSSNSPTSEYLLTQLK